MKYLLWAPVVMFSLIVLLIRVFALGADSSSYTNTISALAILTFFSIPLLSKRSLLHGYLVAVLLALGIVASVERDTEYHTEFDGDVLIKSK
jgi:hypothetical protein